MSSRVAIVALLFALGCAAPGVEAPIDGETTPALIDAGSDGGELEQRFVECARCHVTEAADHAASMHAQAWSDPLFQREWSHGRPTWCVGCHAPLAEDANDPRVSEGVGCASCHVEDGAITSRVVSGRAPHPSRADAHFADVERCGTCHEFDFPSRHGRHEPLQRTLSEWRTSSRDERCVDCHMEESDTGTSHRLLGPRDVELMARALDVDVHAERRGAAIVVTATLRVVGAGHAVPTGDLNRRLVLRATSDGAAAEAELARIFDRDEDGETIEIADQRVLPGVDRRLALTLPAASGTRVRWSLTWSALATSPSAASAIDPRLGAIEVARGTVRVAR